MVGRQPPWRMAAKHVTHFEDASRMKQLKDGDINLIVTSPPYPMIEMWDGIFAKSDPEIAELIANDEGWGAFENPVSLAENEFQDLQMAGISCFVTYTGPIPEAI